MKTNIVSAICFLAFVLSGLAVAASSRFRPGWNSRRSINVFLFVSLLVSFAAGLTQHNMWPFSSWPVLAMPMPAFTRDLPTLRIVAVDAMGNEYDIDYRAWKPLALEELTSWMKSNFFQLDPIARDRAGSYLLDCANRAREQGLSPAGLAYPNRWLGPLTAPTHLLHPAIWSRSESVPRNSFIGLRIYKESWDLEERLHDPTRVTRELAYEYAHR
jgi:hypothetical protein